MKYAAVMLATVLLVSGCTTASVGVIKAIATGDVTDRVLARIADFNDIALRELSEAQDALDKKQARLDKAKCLFPLPALIRYATSSETRAAAVLKDCGLAVNLEAVVVSVPN